MLPCVCSAIGTLSNRRFRWRRRRDDRQETGARTASGCGLDNKLSSLSKARENVTPCSANFRRVGGKFISLHKAFDYFAFRQGYVQLKGNARLILVSCVKGTINANEFAIYDVNMSKNPLFPYDNYEQM